MLGMGFSKHAMREREVCGVEKREEKRERGNVSFLNLTQQGKTWRVLTPLQTRAFPVGGHVGYFCVWVEFLLNIYFASILPLSLVFFFLLF